MGIRVQWIKGERTFVTGKDGKGRDVVRNGKNGGPVVKQDVTKVIIPTVGR
jgi:hypothetical protein